LLNGILLVDKAPGWTSHDVVAKCRGLFAGTLDPMATGLLVLFIGRATRAVPYFPGDKTYRAALRFGIETDTQDSTGRILQKYETIPPAEALQEILPRFTGHLLQTPPMVSAVKIGGTKLYELARKGIEVERPPRPVEVYEFCHLGEKDGEHTVRIHCSAGTYVRSLIHDIGQELGSGAVMTALRRTHSGPFCVDGAVPVGSVTPELVREVAL
jgi:tRNA pseudouridine55 synthase